MCYHDNGVFDITAVYRVNHTPPHVTCITDAPVTSRIASDPGVNDYIAANLTPSQIDADMPALTTRVHLNTAEGC